MNNEEQENKGEEKKLSARVQNESLLSSHLVVMVIIGESVVLSFV